MTSASATSTPAITTPATSSPNSRPTTPTLTTPPTAAVPDKAQDDSSKLRLFVSLLKKYVKLQQGYPLKDEALQVGWEDVIANTGVPQIHWCP